MLLQNFYNTTEGLVLGVGERGLADMIFWPLKLAFWSKTCVWCFLRNSKVTFLVHVTRKKKIFNKRKVRTAVSCMYSKFVCRNFHYLGHLVPHEVASCHHHTTIYWYMYINCILYLVTPHMNQMYKYENISGYSYVSRNTPSHTKASRKDEGREKCL